MTRQTVVLLFILAVALGLEEANQGQLVKYQHFQGQEIGRQLWEGGGGHGYDFSYDYGGYGYSYGYGSYDYDYDDYGYDYDDYGNDYDGYGRRKRVKKHSRRLRKGIRRGQEIGRQLWEDDNGRGYGYSYGYGDYSYGYGSYDYDYEDYDYDYEDYDYDYEDYDVNDYDHNGFDRRKRSGKKQSRRLRKGNRRVGSSLMPFEASTKTQPYHSKAHQQGHQNEGFSACILFMDDNFRLIEWLAFHYHVLPLRNLVVAVDPRSQTSPVSVLERWRDYISIEVWHDQDFFMSNGLPDSGGDLIKLHRTRQRIFYVKCLKHLREQGATWTLTTDVDEYTYVNPRARDPSDSLYQADKIPASIGNSGSVLKMLNSVIKSSEKMSCLPLPRLQFGGIESLPEEVDRGFPQAELSPTLRAIDFETFRWRQYGRDSTTGRNGTLPGKTIVDLSSIGPEDEALFSGDPHRPIDILCNPANVWLHESRSFFITNHMLGTIEQYAARDDSRLKDRILTYEARKSVGGHISEEVRPWLQGFVSSMGKAEAQRLLAGVGQVEMPSLHYPRCSLNFFGLPRSFKTIVLPSLVENVLLPNSKYNCDIFVHYYQVEHEEGGRLNQGGKVDAESILALETVARVVAAHAGKDPPNVVIKGETMAEFNSNFGAVVSHFQTHQDPKTGQLVYFPSADKSWTMKEIKNVVMQWNSIQSAWNEMMKKTVELGIQYERIAFLRSDVFYATPVDIFKLEKDTYDFANRYAVIPGFGKYPVSDRMIYGPFAAVKIWATERFARLDHHIDTYEEVGYGMHSERFLDHEILPAIVNETGVQVFENIDICFYRARPEDAVLISDCDDEKGGVTRGIRNIDQKQLVEQLVGRECSETPLDSDCRFVQLSCSGEPKKDDYSISRWL